MNLTIPINYTLDAKAKYDEARPYFPSEYQGRKGYLMPCTFEQIKAVLTIGQLGKCLCFMNPATHKRLCSWGWNLPVQPTPIEVGRYVDADTIFHLCDWMDESLVLLFCGSKAGLITNCVETSA